LDVTDQVVQAALVAGLIVHGVFAGNGLELHLKVDIQVGDGVSRRLEAMRRVPIGLNPDVGLAVDLRARHTQLPPPRAAVSRPTRPHTVLFNDASDVCAGSVGETHCWLTVVAGVVEA